MRENPRPCGRGAPRPRVHMDPHRL